MLASQKTISPEGAKEVAQLLLDVVPQAMRALRGEMRDSRGGTLTVPQFRILAHLWRGPASNKALAEQLGVSVPAMSRMLKHLAEKKLVERIPSTSDRRNVEVRLSPLGLRHFENVRNSARARISDRFSAVESRKLARLESGLTQLQVLLSEHYGK